MTRLFSPAEPIQVTADADGTPLTFHHRDHWRTVLQVCNRWRVTTNWWNPGAGVAREYVKLVTADGLLCTIYRDMRNDAWYMDRIYD